MLSHGIDGIGGGGKRGYYVKGPRENTTYSIPQGAAVYAKGTGVVHYLHVLPIETPALDFKH